MSDFLLKILSGPNFGAEAILQDGAYLIGSGSGCDIILNDVMVAEQHLRIDVGTDGLLYTPLFEPLYAEGVAIEGSEARALPLYQVLTLGTTSIAVGQVDGVWPSLRTPDLRMLRRPRQVSASGKILPNSFRERLQFLDRRFPYLFPIGLLIILLGFGFVLAEILNWQPRTQSVEVSSVTQAQVEQLLKPLSDQLLVEFSQRDGRLAATIYVADESGRLAINQLLHKFVGLMYIQVWQQDNMLEAARLLAKVYAIPAEITSPKFGAITATGLAISGNEQKRWASFNRQLEVDIPGIKTWNVNLVTRAQFDASIQRILAQYGLNGQVTYEYVEPELTFNGLLDESLRLKWQSCRQVVTKLYSPPLEIISNVQFQAPDVAAAKTASSEAKDGSTGADGQQEGGAVPEALSTVKFETAKLGPEGWISLGGNEKYFPGSVLFDGWRLKSITSEGIYLALEDESKLVKWEKL